jgi:predicted porin
MKKTLIATAIAAAALSSTAFAEDMTKDLSARMDAMPTVYGNIQLAYGHQGVEVSGSPEQTQNTFFDNGSTIGLKHEHEIAPGIKGFLKAEMEFKADDSATSGGLNKLDEAFIGVKGGFGSVLVGSEDTVYEWTDMIDFTETASVRTNILFDNKFAGEIAKDEEGDQLQYVSPSIAGGLKVGISVPLTNETLYAGQLAGMFSNDMLDVALAYSMGKTLDATADGIDNGTEYGDSIGLGAKVKLNNFAIIGQYETRSADANAAGVENNATERDLAALAGIVSLGKSQFALGYKMEENGADVAEEKELIFLQALHNMSDNMYAYVEYGVGTIEEGAASTDTEALAIGAAYVF